MVQHCKVCSDADHQNNCQIRHRKKEKITQTKKIKWGATRYFSLALLCLHHNYYNKDDKFNRTKAKLYRSSLRWGLFYASTPWSVFFFSWEHHQCFSSVPEHHHDELPQQYQLELPNYHVLLVSAVIPYFSESMFFMLICIFLCFLLWWSWLHW